VILRRLRNRFGLAAPKVAIRAELPVYWRVAAVIGLAACLFALAIWIYDAGRRFAGFHQEESSKELSELRSRVIRLETEKNELSKIANSSDSRLQIESTTQEQLAKQLRTLEDENSQLKADLAMFENLAGGDTGGGPLAISRLQVVADDISGQYRYRLLVAQKGEKREREFKGSLQLAVSVQRGGETVIINHPTNDSSEAARFAVAFRYFRRLEGKFSIPPNDKLIRVDARLIENGAVRATQSLTI
jgi:hypothetical protein